MGRSATFSYPMLPISKGYFEDFAFQYRNRICKLNGPSVQAANNVKDFTSPPPLPIPNRRPKLYAPRLRPLRCWFGFWPAYLESPKGGVRHQEQRENWQRYSDVAG